MNKKSFFIRDILEDENEDRQSLSDTDDKEIDPLDLTQSDGQRTLTSKTEGKYIFLIFYNYKNLCSMLHERCCET